MTTAPGAERLAHKVLLIGWDAADWQVIHPLMDQGLMPTLQRFVSEGVMGNLASLDPMYSPCLWTSIATGKRMHKHGIHWFLEPDGDGRGVTFSRSTSRQCKAIWNILTQAGLRTHAVGWLASHPAEPINGVCVSDNYPACSLMTGRAEKAEPDAIYPSDAVEPLMGLRLDPCELTGEVIAPFIPELKAIQESGDIRPSILAKLLAECSNVHNAATWAMANRQWDFASVYYDSIDHFCHGFMNCHPPQMDGLDSLDFARYRDVVTGCYRFHDMMLARLLELAGPETTVILVSDHGFLSNELRPRAVPRMMAGNVIWHRYHGVFAMKGPHVRRDEWIHDLSILDVTPTVLRLFGLPVGTDMDGKPILQALESPRDCNPPMMIASWEEVPGECGQHPADRVFNPYDNQAAIQRLVELGYIDPLDESAETNIAKNRIEANYALAADYYDAGMFAESIPLLQQLIDEMPRERRFVLRLVQCYQASGRFEEARSALNPLIEGDCSDPNIALIAGSLEMQTGNLNAASKFLDVAEENEARSPRPLPWLWTTKGELHLMAKSWKEASEKFERALAIDPHLPAAHYGLSVAYSGMERLAEAAASALHAISLRPSFPLAHYQLGVILLRCREFAQASNALRTALRYDPNLACARELLSTLANIANGQSLSTKHRNGQRKPPICSADAVSSLAGVGVAP